MTPDEVRFCLLRRDDVPATNPHNLASSSACMDTKGEMDESCNGRSDGMLAFPFALQVSRAKT